jgi:hypothetical protein
MSSSLKPGGRLQEPESEALAAAAAPSLVPDAETPATAATAAEEAGAGFEEEAREDMIGAGGGRGTPEAKRSAKWRQTPRAKGAATSTSFLFAVAPKHIT